MSRTDLVVTVAEIETCARCIADAAHFRKKRNHVLTFAEHRVIHFVLHRPVPSPGDGSDG